MTEDSKLTAHSTPSQGAATEMLPYSAAAAIATGLLTIWALFVHLPAG